MLVVAESKCHLECANGGHCIFDPNHIVSHLHHNIHNDFATGILRELCLCPIGYTGIACLTPTDSVEECHHLNGTHLCHNGGFCRQVLTSIDGGDDINVMEWKCDCLEADKVSSFAGAMCRNPHTDYCNDDGSAFCTNGGSCRSSLVSFDIDTEYMGSEGCLCPPEFSGPHCEFLTTLITEDNLPTIKTPELTPIEGETTTHNGIFSINTPLFVGLGLLMIVGTFLILRNKAQRYDSTRRQRRMNQFVSEQYGNDANFSDNNNGDDYEEYIMHDIVLT